MNSIEDVHDELLDYLQDLSEALEFIESNLNDAKVAFSDIVKTVKTIKKLATKETD